MNIVFVKIWLHLETWLWIKIEKADRLSRRSDWKIRVEKDNENWTLIKEQWICNLAKVVIEKIKIAREKDKEVVRVVEEIKKIGVKMLKRDE